MVLVDMNQVTLSSLMMQIGQSKDLQVNPDLVRHMVLNSIRTYRIKFVEDVMIVNTIGEKTFFHNINLIVRK